MGKTWIWVLEFWLQVLFGFEASLNRKEIRPKLYQTSFQECQMWFDTFKPKLHTEFNGYLRLMFLSVKQRSAKKDIKTGWNIFTSFCVSHFCYILCIPYARHHKPSWIQAIHKDRIFWKNFLKNKKIVFENGVKNIQAAAYNGARTVFVTKYFDL